MGVWGGLGYLPRVFAKSLINSKLCIPLLGWVLLKRLQFAGWNVAGKLQTLVLRSVNLFQGNISYSILRCRKEAKIKPNDHLFEQKNTNSVGLFK